jgi:large subunit ribosomal protein L19
VSNELLKIAAAGSMKTEVPEFKIGDTVNVSVRIVEGDRERIQVFSGVVIARRGGGVNETFTVRRIVNNEGVERIFPLHSPKVADVEVLRSGRTRRAKLFYLRDRTGKATRLKEIRKPSKKAESK